jgi:peroxiredoxin
MLSRTSSQPIIKAIVIENFIYYNRIQIHFYNLKKMQKYILCFLCFILIGSKNKEVKSSFVKLPLTIVNGYGPFRPSMAILTEEEEHTAGNPMAVMWSKTNLPIKGIPKNWKKTAKTKVDLNIQQLVYQNYISGNISKEWYKLLQSDWQWVPDEQKLSKNAIKCYVYVIWGTDPSGNKMVMVDTNNNLDFSDEKAFLPEVLDYKTNIVSTQNQRFVNYEIYRQGKITAAQIPIVIKEYKGGFVFNFPQFVKTQLIQNGKKHEIAVINSGMTTANFEATAIIEITNIDKDRKLYRKDLIQLRENIIIGEGLGVKYKNRGVDLYTNVLQLEPLSPDGFEYSMQEGYPFQPFSANEFSTKKSISLADYKGKYVFIDFWGTGCRGCVEDIPNLVKIYKGLDKKRFEFVGIVGNDTPERLKRFIDKNEVSWPQILSDKNNRLVEQYQVTGYPTTVLLDPTGKIIAKNIYSRGLQLKLNELTSK